MQKSGIKFLRILPRTIVGLFLAVVSVVDANAGGLDCEICEKIMAKLSEVCLGGFSTSFCDEDTYLNALDRIPSFMPEAVQGRVWEVIDEYRLLFYELYSSGDIPNNDEMCFLTALCERSCPDCDSVDWASSGTGYEKRILANCNGETGVCHKTTEYRCAAGYYGSSTNGTSGCSICSPYNNMAAGSAPGSTTQTSCFIPSALVWDFSDDAGTGKAQFVSNCYYSN